jgi:hypothetical protein
MSKISDLKNLEFENLEVSRGEEHEVNDSKNEDQILIDYSSNVIIALNNSMKAHNKDCENKVSLKELKEVFRNGADCSQAKEGEIPCGVLALARVNMFLRLKLGEIMEASNSLTGSLDISDSWHPSELDFTKAKELIKKHDLNYEFKDVGNLYLEEYTKIELEY